MRNPLAAPTIQEMFLNSGKSSPQDEDMFNHLCLPNGTFKTTHAGRLQDADDLLLTLLAQKQETLEVLDVGVSSGTLTAELAARLTASGISHRTHGCDLYINALCVHWFLWTILFLSPHSILQVDLLKLAFPNSPPSRLSGIVFFTARIIIRWLSRSRTSLPLLSRTARTSPVLFSSGDVFGTLCVGFPDLKFDVVRVANVLNLSYFSEAAIQTAGQNLWRVLNDRGVLVLVRSNGEQNRCTILRKIATGFEVIADQYGGIEVAQLIVAAGSTAASGE